MILHVFITGWKLSPGDFDLCKSEVFIMRFCFGLSVYLLYPMDFRELHADRILQVTSALNYSQKCMCTFSHLLPFRKGLHRYTPSCIQICIVGKKNKRCKRKKVFKCLMCATLFKVWGQYFIKINHFIKLRGIKLTNSERVDFIWINSVLWENFRLERHI